MIQPVPPHFGHSVPVAIASIIGQTASGALRLLVGQTIDFCRLSPARAAPGLRASTFVADFRPGMDRQIKFVVEKHPDGYVAYPLGLKGIVVGEGDSYEEALADVVSAVQFHIETFGATRGRESAIVSRGGAAIVPPRFPA